MYFYNIIIILFKMEGSDKTKKIASIFDSAGSMARSGIVSGARYLAKGIDKTGEYVKGHTTEATEPSKMPILPAIQVASKTTSFVVGGTHKLLGKAVNKTVQVAGDA